MDPPEDYYTATTIATEAAGKGHAAEMDSHTLLYLLEFYRITKIGGSNSSYACADWPGIQIPQAILILLDNKGLQFTFSTAREKARTTSCTSTSEIQRDEGWISTTTRRISPTSSGMQLNSAA